MTTLMVRGNILGLGLTLVVAACSSSSSDASAEKDGTADGGRDPSGEATGGGNGVNGGNGANAGSTDAAPGGSGASCPKDKYGTLVILGDSISDVGGGGGGDGQQPFYRELLLKNDDALYPAWAGKDLTACWGVSSTNVVKVSHGGDTTSDLMDQIANIPDTLPGPVLVVGTIGGNDVQAALPKLAFGGDSTNDIKKMRKNLDDAFGELTKADRFGAGVKVQVLMTNVYDPSDGTGNFAFADGKKCPGLLSLWPGSETATKLKPFNDAMAEEAAKYPGVQLLDLHSVYQGHGAPAKDTWFYTDCIHPNTAGHQAIREVFWTAMLPL